MFEVIAGAFALAVIACLVLFGLLWWIVTLPFRILGFLLGAAGFVLAIPFLVVGGLVALAGLVLAGLFFVLPMLLLPLLPVVFVGWLIWWMFFRPQRVRTA